jgi:hypothetical protein
MLSRFATCTVPFQRKTPEILRTLRTGLRAAELAAAPALPQQQHPVVAPTSAAPMFPAACSHFRARSGTASGVLWRCPVAERQRPPGGLAARRSRWCLERAHFWWISHASQSTGLCRGRAGPAPPRRPAPTTGRVFATSYHGWGEAWAAAARPQPRNSAALWTGRGAVKSAAQRCRRLVPARRAGQQLVPPPKGGRNPGASILGMPPWAWRSLGRSALAAREE